MRRILPSGTNRMMTVFMTYSMSMNATAMNGFRKTPISQVIKSP